MFTDIFLVKVFFMWFHFETSGKPVRKLTSEGWLFAETTRKKAYSHPAMFLYKNLHTKAASTIVLFSPS